MIVKNPIIWADMPDPDVIRVGDTYYMVSTTMFYMPGAPILKSKDLTHWEITSYVFEQIENNDIYNLANKKNAYGKGQWATSLTFYKGCYYACFVCYDMGKTYIYHTKDIEAYGWERVEINAVYHDMSFLFWEDTPYLVYGNGEIQIVELTPDLSGIRQGGVHQILFRTPSKDIMLRCEGCRAYVKNGFIYLLLIEWPEKGNGLGRRRVVCYRSEHIFGPYERRILLDDDMGYDNCGIAQGVLIEGEAGDWYSILFQDHGAVGRIPYLIPITWEEGWPIFGIEGKVPTVFEIPMEEYEAKPLVISDSFNQKENQLALQWQWNHNPNPDAWSFTKRPGYLRLYTREKATNIMEARNTLTQRTTGPFCSFQVTLETDGMKEGDYAGLCGFQGRYGLIGVKKEQGENRIVQTKKGSYETQEEEISISLGTNVIELQISFDFSKGKDEAVFSYCKDGMEWITFGTPLSMVYTLDVFAGYRIGIFYYAQNVVDGYADFKNFKYISHDCYLN